MLEGWHRVSVLGQYEWFPLEQREKSCRAAARSGLGVS